MFPAYPLRPARNPAHLTGRQEFETVQALRAVAALMVVFCHCLLRLAEQGSFPISQAYLNGAAGVDLFFVISGFVMVVSSQKLAGMSFGWRTFIWRRLIRIVPLYWLVTTAKLVLVAVAPSIALHGHYSLTNIISSYLFIPSRNSDGDLRPVLSAGWTLSFEMLFYVLFAVTLLLRQPPLRLLTPIFAVLALIGLVRTDEWPAYTRFASDLPIEFLFGVAVGLLTLKGWRLNARQALLAILLGFSAILFLPSGPALGAAKGVGRISLRVITWGIPAAFIVAASVSLNERWRVFLPRWLLALGNASYSIYLLHAFITPVVGVAVAHLHLPETATKVLMVALGVPASGAAGYALYHFVEFPMTELLKKRSAKATHSATVEIAK